LQFAIVESNDPGDLNHYIHDDEDSNPAFSVAINKMQRSQKCFPTLSEHGMDMMSATTLQEFCEGKESDDYFDKSMHVIQKLGYVDSNMRLTMDHNVLSMIWEMSDMLPDAIHLCATLEQMYFNFCYNKTKNFKESDATQNDFLSVLLHVVDRVPAKEGEESLQEYLRIVSSEDGTKQVNEDAIALWKETEEILSAQKDLIQSMDISQEEKDKMHLALPPGGGPFGPALDKGVYEMIVLKQKGFHEEQSTVRRNELKNRIVRLGQICLLAHNNLQQPHGKYNALEVHFRKMFKNIKYCVSDMMTQLTDQSDFTEI
jgi:hypothetical protein